MEGHMSDKAIAYFQRSAVKYSKGDVEELLRKRLDCTGPLLTVVLNGIDNLGGMCYGFGPRNVGSRSVTFMKNEMNIPESVAESLYEIVRCGIVHQGMPKIGIIFYLDYDRLDKGKIVRKNSDYIWLNVTELAYSYLEAIDLIADDPEKHIYHYPKPDDHLRIVLENALENIRDSIYELVDDIGHKEESEWEEMLKKGEIDHMPSKSAYSPENVFALRMDLPPVD